MALAAAAAERLLFRGGIVMIEKAGGRRRTEEGRGDGWIDVRSGLRVRRADDIMMLWSFRRKMRIFMRSVGCSGCLPLLALCALLLLLVVRLACTHMQAR